MQDDFSHEDLTDPMSRISCAVAAIKSLHRDLAENNRTPFLHPRLYKDHLPTSMLNVFTTSVLYANKTAANEAMVFRIMDKNVSDLLETAKKPHRTPQEDLARVQALLLYQTIRIFDGDIRQRAYAEAAMPILEEWTDHLCQLRDTPGSEMVPNGGSTVLPVPKSWQVSNSSFGYSSVLQW
jgi:hypothetical protein